MQSTVGSVGGGGALSTAASGAPLLDVDDELDDVDDELVLDALDDVDVVFDVVPLLDEVDDDEVLLPSSVASTESSLTMDAQAATNSADPPTSKVQRIPPQA